MPESIPPVPYQQDPIDPRTRKISGEWLRWLNTLKDRAQNPGSGGALTISASQIVSGVISLARLAGITRTELSPSAGILGSQLDAAANIAWTQIEAADLPLDRVPTGIPADSIADGSISNTEFQFLDGLTGNIQTQINNRIPKPSVRKSAWINFWPGNQVPEAVGWITLTTAGTLSDGSNATHQMQRYTGAVSGTTLGPRINGSIPLHQIRHDPEYLVYLQTGADITNVRYFFGFHTSTNFNGDGASANCFGIRYSTVAGDSGWVGVSNDGGVTPSVTASLGAIAASTEYLLRIRVTGGGTSIAFSVNGGTELTLTTDLPSGSTGLFPVWCLTPQAAVSKSMDLSYAYMEWDSGSGSGGSGGGGIFTPNRGDLLRGGTSGLWGRLSIGASGTVLRSDGTDPSWSTDGTGLDVSASKLTTGTVPLARLSNLTNAEIAAAAAIAWTKISKTGSSLADLATRSAADLSSGTLADARLSANVPLINAANVFTADQRVNGAIGINAAPNATDGTLTLSDGIFERSRATKLGEWIAVAFNAGNFSGNGAMTWTLASGDQLSFTYTLVGKTMFVTGYFNTTTVGGTLNTDLRVTIPGGFTSNALVIGICRVSDAGGADAAGTVYVTSGGTTINFQKINAANWSTATDNTRVQFSLAFEVQ